MNTQADGDLLRVRELTVSFPGAAPAVCEVSFTMRAGEAVCLAGESGSGKTQTALALMGLSPPTAHVAGSVSLGGLELLGAPEDVLNGCRARRIAMIFQDPLAALNPYLTIGDQLLRILVDHDLAEGRAARARVLGMLERVGLPDAARQYHAYPHELSGGMRQRALIAAALIADPEILIADEPTTALDVTIQAQILELLASLRRELRAALLLITHDLAVAAAYSDRLLVLDRGMLIEAGDTRTIFAAPSHPRTVAMLTAARRLAAAAPPGRPVRRDATGDGLLVVEHLHVDYRERRRFGRRTLSAVQDVSLTVARGETVGIVGESGSGKTSLARAIVGLTRQTAGTVRFLGSPLNSPVESRASHVRRALQMVFQDPVASLNPAMRVSAIIGEPLAVHERSMNRRDRQRAVREMLDRVDLDAALMNRYPHELSGGQAQRVAIARALIGGPALLVCDEAVAALDGSVRIGILELLRAEQERLSLSLLMITHDLMVVRQLSHRVLVMYMGRVLEFGDTHKLFHEPRHPYARLLLDSTPVPNPDAPRPVLAGDGEPGSILHPPSGCVFHPRCPYAVDLCRSERPRLRTIAGTAVACHRAETLDLSLQS